MNSMFTKDGAPLTAPDGFREVTAAEFWQALTAAGPRSDPMPSCENPNATRWKTRGGELWGWQYPGYSNGYGCAARGQHRGLPKPKRYFLQGVAC